MIGMRERIEELSLFIQERCLWQFHSRSWDRKENIGGILDKVAEILTGASITPATLQDRCFYADAKILAREIKNRLTWVDEIDGAQLKTVIAGVQEKLIDITVTRSLNAELNVPNY
jgi:V-containing nitrogenase delta subunit